MSNIRDYMLATTGAGPQPNSLNPSVKPKNTENNDLHMAPFKVGKMVEAGGPGSGPHKGSGSMYLNPRDTTIVKKGSHQGYDYEVHHNPGYAGSGKYGNDKQQIVYSSAKAAERGAKQHIEKAISQKWSGYTKKLDAGGPGSGPQGGEFSKPGVTQQTHSMLTNKFGYRHIGDSEESSNKFYSRGIGKSKRHAVSFGNDGWTHTAPGRKSTHGDSVSGLYQHLSNVHNIQ